MICILSAELSYKVDIIKVICMISESYSASFTGMIEIKREKSIIIRNNYEQNLSSFVCCISRYYAILHPMRARFVCTRARSRKAIIAIWFSSFFMATPILIGQVNSSNPNRTGK